MKRIILMVTVALVMAAVMALAGPAFADHGHRHFLITPNEERIAVGPQVCTNPENHEGFSHFHERVHFGTPNEEAFQQDNNPVGFEAVRGCPS